MVTHLILGAIIALSSFATATPIASPDTSSGSSNSSEAVVVTATAIPVANALATPAAVVKQALGGPAAVDYHSPAYLPNGQKSLSPALSQSDTNGQSVWGTLDAPLFGPWINTSGQPMPSGTPWGSATSSNTNYYDDVPNTGMTRSYEFTISPGTIAPDGVEKQALLINGQFPGPQIEANWGDFIEVCIGSLLQREKVADSKAR